MYEKDKRSFFEKLTGTINIEEEEEDNQPIGGKKPEYLKSRDDEESTQIPLQNVSDPFLSNQSERNEDEDEEEEEEDEPETQDEKEEEVKEEDGELAVDVYENENEIFVQAMIAGVETEDMDVSITRDMVTVKGKRQNVADVPDENYYNKELYWGRFSRKILLPEEIDPEKSEAIEKHGLLILRLPKLNKKKSQKLEVKAL